MAAPMTSAQSQRIDAAELKERMEAGEACTVLDGRAPQAWESSAVKIRGAIRVDPHDFRVDPSWPKDRLTVVY
jgi:rhodanese-related sulfurtransferase